MKLEELKIKFNEKFPNSDIHIIKRLEIKKRNILIVLTSFGLCRVDFYHLFSGKIPSIKTALNKTEFFINNANKVHNNKYNYCKTIYINSRTKVDIICPIHGKFNQEANSHLQGIGCIACRNDKLSEYSTGWSLTEWKERINSKYFDSFKVYIIKCWDENEEFYKIGRTCYKINKRFNGKTLMPYKYKILKEFIGDSDKIFKLEQDLKNQNKKHKYIPKIKFRGMYECFSEIKY